MTKVESFLQPGAEDEAVERACAKRKKVADLCGISKQNRSSSAAFRDPMTGPVCRHFLRKAKYILDRLDVLDIVDETIHRFLSAVVIFKGNTIRLKLISILV